jgi:putative transposase
MANPAPLVSGIHYHIYNRGNNRETLFRSEENYRYFLKLYAVYVEPVAITYAYCLLPNHFHLHLRVRTLQEQIEWFEKFGTEDTILDRLPLSPGRQLGNLFNAYAKAVNKAFDRSGSLFQKPFQRIPVTEQSYLVRLICYIHRNPQRHGTIDDFTRWPYSSYRSLLSSLPTRLERESVVGWFGGQEGFRRAHQHDWSSEGERLFYEAGAGDA